MDTKSFKFNTLPRNVLIGAILGIATGLILGKNAVLLNPVGQVYIKLMQAVVYPYLICAIIIGVGSLTPKIAKNLFKSGVPFYILMLFITFVVLWGVTQFLPLPHLLVKENIYIANQTNSTVLVNILIPQNLFDAIASNYVPAIVIFSIIFGIGVQRYKDKHYLLNILHNIRAACITIWSWIVKLSPIGVFALLATTTGTIDLKSWGHIVIYLILFGLAVITLGFWLLPMLISSFTQIKYREIIYELRDALLISISTTLSVSALPFIERSVTQLLKKNMLYSNKNDELTETTATIAYPISQLGNFFLYLYIIFALVFFHIFITYGKYDALPLITTLSAIGSPSSSINAAAFLSQWLHLPSQSTNLYVELMSVTRYGQVVISVIGMFFLTVLTLFAYYKKIKLNSPRLIKLLISLIIVILVFYFIGHQFSQLTQTRGKQLLNINLAKTLTNDIDVQFNKNIAINRDSTSSLKQILHSKNLRVGYNPYSPPFVYYNKQGKLVGFDIALTYALAKSMNVNIVFIPYKPINLIKDIETNKFDIAIGGIIESYQRLMHTNMSKAYLTSKMVLIVKQTDNSLRTNSNAKNQHLNIAIFNQPLFRHIAKKHFPNQPIHIIKGLPNFIKNATFTALCWTDINSNALQNIYPNKFFSYVPKQIHTLPPVNIAIMMNLKSTNLLQYINYWLVLPQTKAFINQQKKYWLISRI